MMTTPTVLQSQAETASFSAGDKIRMDLNLALEKIQSVKLNGSEEAIRKVF